VLDSGANKAADYRANGGEAGGRGGRKKLDEKRHRERSVQAGSRRTRLSRGTTSILSNKERIKGSEWGEKVGRKAKTQNCFLGGGSWWE